MGEGFPHEKEVVGNGVREAAVTSTSHLCVDDNFYIFGNRQNGRTDWQRPTDRQSRVVAGQSEVDQVQAQISEIGLCRLHCADNAGGAFVSSPRGWRATAEWGDNGNGQPVRPGIV